MCCLCDTLSCLLTLSCCLCFPQQPTSATSSSSSSNTTMLQNKKKKKKKTARRRTKRQRDTPCSRSVVTTFRDDGSFPKVFSGDAAASTPPIGGGSSSSTSSRTTSHHHDMFSGFISASTAATPMLLSRVSTSSSSTTTIAADDSIIIWSTQSAPPNSSEKTNMKNTKARSKSKSKSKSSLCKLLFQRRSSKTSRRFRKLENEEEMRDDDHRIAGERKQQQQQQSKKRQPGRPTMRLTTVSETRTEERLQHVGGPIDLDDDTIHEMIMAKKQQQSGPVDLDDSVTSDGTTPSNSLLDEEVERESMEKERRSDAQFLQQQEQHFAELDAIVKNFQDGKYHYDDDTTTTDDEEDIENTTNSPAEFVMTDMLETNEETEQEVENTLVERDNQDDTHDEEIDNDDAQLAAAVAAVAAEIAGLDLKAPGEPTANIHAKPLQRPLPRTPRTDPTRKPLPSSSPETPITPTQSQSQRFHLSPSFKEIICNFQTNTSKKIIRGIPRHHHSSLDASPYSQSSYLSDVSSLSGGGGGYNHDDETTTPKQQDDKGPKLFQHTAWLSPSSNGIVPKTSYPTGAMQGQRQNNTEPSSSYYQPFEFVLTDSGSDEEDMEGNANIINADTQLSAQMMAMGQEILRKLTGNAVVNNTESNQAVAQLPKGESPAASTTKNTTASHAKCLMLLMDPRRRIFEVIPVFSTATGSVVVSVADLLSQIPHQATDYRLKFQEYVGICYSDDDESSTTGDRHYLRLGDVLPTALLQNHTAMAKKPLFAVPQHYTSDQIELFGGTLLKNQKVRRMIHDHQVLLGMKTTARK